MWVDWVDGQAGLHERSKSVAASALRAPFSLLATGAGSRQSPTALLGQSTGWWNPLAEGRPGRAGRRAAAKHWAEIEEARRSDAGGESPAKQAGARKISHQTSQLSMHQTVEPSDPQLTRPVSIIPTGPAEHARSKSPAEEWQ